MAAILMAEVSKVKEVTSFSTSVQLTMQSLFTIFILKVTELWNMTFSWLHFTSNEFYFLEVTSANILLLIHEIRVMNTLYKSRYKFPLGLQNAVPSTHCNRLGVKYQHSSGNSKHCKFLWPHGVLKIFSPYNLILFTNYLHIAYAS